MCSKLHTYLNILGHYNLLLRSLWASNPVFNQVWAWNNPKIISNRQNQTLRGKGQSRSLLLIATIGIVVLVMLSNCSKDQNDADLNNLVTSLDDDFENFKGSNWAASTQSADSGTTPPSSFSVANATANASSHVLWNVLSCFTFNNISVADGRLRLNARTQNVNCPDSSKTYQFTGGELRSQNRYSYGIFHAQIKTNLNNGALTSFFLRSDNSEIGFHFRGDDATTVNISYRNGDFKLVKGVPLSKNAKEAFSSYTILWGTDIIQWSINDEPLVAFKDQIPSELMQVHLVTWVTGDRTQAEFPSSTINTYSDFDLIQIQQFK